MSPAAAHWTVLVAHPDTSRQPVSGIAVQVRRSSDQFELTATVHLGGLAALRDAPALHLALAAVIEDYRGALSYWALDHPPGKPDFHHPDGFTIDLRAS